MSTYVLMKILESSPSRYDKGLRILTLGRLDKAYDRLASQITHGQKVLDIGCGTGALAIRAALQGALVKGIDINPEMLEIARTKIQRLRLESKINLCEMGVAELENEESGSYDVVMSGLCFSELSGDELYYTLMQAKRILKPGGRLLIADESRPEDRGKRMVSRLLRIPLASAVWLITQTTSKAVADLPEKIERAGFILHFVRRSFLQDFIEVTAYKRKRVEDGNP